MKVAVIPTIRDFPWGAPGHCMGVLVEALMEAGHQVLLFVAPIDWENSEVERLRTAGAQTVLLPDAATSYSRLKRLRQFTDRLLSPRPTLEEVLTRFGPDHLFLNQAATWCGVQPPFFDALQAYPGRYSLICHSNFPRPPLPPEALARARRLVAGAARVFFNSQWCRELAELQLTAPIPTGRVFQVPVRFRFEQPLPWPKSQIPRLAMVSRLDVFTKGMDVTLQAVAQLRQEGVPLQLGIYGAGHDEGYLRELARFLNVDEAVVFKGHMDRIEDVWREEEMLLLPSRFEGLCVAMVEALGFGRPVLRTPYGGAAEWMEDGVNGYLCPAAEVSLLTATLRRALAERGRWPEMGRCGHAKVKAGLHSDPAKVFLEALR
jgi:glycosyltransferase involved in cell wall biosynthesis